jgi:uncharacterized protein with PQ loop repeat
MRQRTFWFGLSMFIGYGYFVLALTYCLMIAIVKPTKWWEKLVGLVILCIIVLSIGQWEDADYSNYLNFM